MSSGPSDLATLFKQYRSQFFLSLVIVSIQQWAGIAAINTYASTIFEISGLTPASASIYSTIMGIGNVLGAVFLIFIFVKFGRRTIYLWGIFLLVILLGAISLSLWLEVYLVTRFCMLGYIFIFSMSAGSLTYVYIPEILPSMLVGIVFWINSVQALIVTYTYLYFVDWFTASGAFLVYSGCCLLGVIYCYFEMEETKGRGFNEMSLVFTNRISLQKISPRKMPKKAVEDLTAKLVEEETENSS